MNWTVYTILFVSFIAHCTQIIIILLLRERLNMAEDEIVRIEKTYIRQNEELRHYLRKEQTQKYYDRKYRYDGRK